MSSCLQLMLIIVQQDATMYS